MNPASHSKASAPNCSNELMLRLQEYLRKQNCRCTPERTALLEAVIAMGSSAFDAEQFHSTLEGKGFHVSRATVYNTLRLLADAGVVRRLPSSTRSHSYRCVLPSRRKDNSLSYTLVCTDCGKTKEIRDPGLAALLAARRYAGFTQSFFTIEVQGLCRACMHRRQSKSDE